VNPEQISEQSIDLLKALIQTSSLSREEGEAASVIRSFLKEHSIPYEANLHNTWCFNLHFDQSKPTILLNSHIDTVKASGGWDTHPLEAVEENGKLTGLGSNDAGASLVSLLAAFRHFFMEEGLPFNICFAATAEEEIGGANGIITLKDVTSNCAFGIIGEPTDMEAAVSERGLMVLDGIATGRTGHAARDEGLNALYLAMEDIEWFRNYRFEKEDPFLGGIKMTVTMIESGSQHNVVPDNCNYVVDVRTVATYTYEKIMAIINENTHAAVKARSMRLKPSSIDRDHLLVVAAEKLGIPLFASTTLSDQSLLDIPTIKMGPGLSERSHTPNEFIHTSEIREGIKTYIRLLREIFNQ